MLVNDGIHLFKYWFSVSRDEQLRRFRSRKGDLLKSWKLSPIDLQFLDKWDNYTDAKEGIFSTRTPQTRLGRLLSPTTQNALASTVCEIF
jgi:polyphosphate kinase 2 (PPK2 family)